MTITSTAPVLLGLFWTLAFGTSASAATPCAKAHLAGSPTQCAGSQVSFDLQKCGGEKSAAAEVSCKGRNGVAFVEHKGVRYEVALNSAKGSWGADSLKLGETREIALAPQTPQAKEAAPVAQAPAAENRAPAAEAPAATEGTTKLTAFIDPQYQWRNDSSLSPGFVLNDAALYLTHTFSFGEGKIDLPFQGNPANNSFAITSGKAQAFFKSKVDSDLSWKLGQWDTIYGVDLNDTSEINLTTQGRVFAVFLPLTHAGLLGTYAKDIFTVNLFAANRFNTGSVAGQNLDYGLQVGAAFAPAFRLTAGVLYQKQPLGGWSLIDLIVSSTLGSYSVDLGLDMLKDPAATDTALGIIFQNNYAINESWNGTARIEYLTKHLAGIDNEFQISVGPQYALGAHMKLKVDYTLNSQSPLGGGDSVKSHGLNAGVVYRFL